MLDYIRKRLARWSRRASPYRSACLTFGPHGYCCTRPAKHRGFHAAHSTNDRVRYVWPATWREDRDQR